MTNSYIVQNIKHDDGTFTENYACSIGLCNNPSRYLLELKFGLRTTYVCKSCLNLLEKKIDNAILEEEKNENISTIIFNATM